MPSYAMCTALGGELVTGRVYALGGELVTGRVQFVVVNDSLDGREPLTSNDELTQFNGILAGNGE